jgi:hypothetical protein
MLFQRLNLIPEILVFCLGMFQFLLEAFDFLVFCLICSLERFLLGLEIISENFQFILLALNDLFAPLKFRFQVSGLHGRSIMVILAARSRIGSH